jgi:hypothetical protein
MCEQAGKGVDCFRLTASFVDQIILSYLLAALCFLTFSSCSRVA